MDEEEIFRLGDVFKIFGDSTRLKLLLLLTEGEMCVLDITQKMNMNQSAVSHQLKILKLNKLVKSRRDGRQMIYSLADEHVYTIIEAGLEHIREDD
ncbi:MAG: metalloregulator ArsR/SmtB family transcription factor [Lachnospiraceae bacterium]|nr:metalloregulator ArsR/SmtB family transcription factor [Lachnospiraceae bacterium]